MEIAWYAVLGLAFATYFTLGGYDYGVAMLARVVGRDEPQRRAVRNAVGPFFLGNEVWLVAAIGVLLGAFPRLEGELFGGLYPLVVAALLGVVAVTAAFQLRGRVRRDGAKRAFDVLLTAGGGVAALSWGAVVGGLLQGVPVGADGHVSTVASAATPYVAVCAVAVALVLAAHGATFLAMRLTGDAAERARAAGRRLTLAAAGAVVVAGVASAASGAVRAALHTPVAAIVLAVLLVVLLLAAHRLLGRRRPAAAFAATVVAAALPVFVVGAGTYPYALVSTVDAAAGITVAEAAAGPDTLRLLGMLAWPAMPVLAGFQVMCWWAFRVRAGRPTVSFY